MAGQGSLWNGLRQAALTPWWLVHLGHRNAWRNTGRRTPGAPADRDANPL